MPNQDNFRSNLADVTEPRFLASRMVRFPTENLLLEEIPASFGYDNEDTVEIHFYTAQDNVLLLSTTVALNSGILKSHIISYDDGTYKNYLEIDFTKLFLDQSLVFIPGDYLVVFNFFSDEIGSYRNRELEIKNISTSRTEVVVGFPQIVPENPSLQQSQQRILDEFAIPSLQKPDAIGAMEKIITSGVKLSSDAEGMTSTNVLANLGDPLRKLTALENAEVLGEIQELLNDFIPRLFDPVRKEIITTQDIYLQQVELIDYLRYAISIKIAKMQSSVNSKIRII
jgi:hypothetical protein